MSNKKSLRFLRVNHARGCWCTNDLRFIITPYVSRFEEDFRPVVMYAIVDAVNGYITSSGLPDEYAAQEEIVNYYA